MTIFDSIRYPVDPANRQTIYAVPQPIWDSYLEIHRTLTSRELDIEIETRAVLRRIILEWGGPYDDIR